MDLNQNQCQMLSEDEEDLENLSEITELLLKENCLTQKHHDRAFDANDFLLVLVRLADKACNKIGIGLTQDQSVVLVATPEANSLNLSDVDLAKLEIMLEDSQVSETQN